MTILLRGIQLYSDYIYSSFSFMILHQTW